MDRQSTLSQGRGRSRGGRAGGIDAVEHGRYYCDRWSVDPEQHMAWSEAERRVTFRECPGEGWHVPVHADVVWSSWAYLLGAAHAAVAHNAVLPFWVGCRRPRKDAGLYRETWYAIVPEIYFLRVLYMYGISLEHPVDERADGIGMDLFTVRVLGDPRRRELRSVPPGLVFQTHPSPAPMVWRLSRWIPEIEEAAPAGTPWVIQVELDDRLPGPAGQSAVIVPAWFWAQLLAAVPRSMVAGKVVEAASR